MVDMLVSLGNKALEREKKSDQKIKAGFPEMMTSELNLQKKTGVRQMKKVDKVIPGTKKACLKP